MQAPPPPLQGPKYEPSVGPSVDPSLDDGVYSSFSAEGIGFTESTTYFQKL